MQSEVPTNVRKHQNFMDIHVPNNHIFRQTRDSNKSIQILRKVILRHIFVQITFRNKEEKYRILCFEALTETERGREGGREGERERERERELEGERNEDGKREKVEASTEKESHFSYL